MKTEFSLQIGETVTVGGVSVTLESVEETEHGPLALLRTVGPSGREVFYFVDETGKQFPLTEPIPHG